jgi:beta-galactosidase GanA
LRVEFTSDAKAEVRQIRRWWRRHRTKAPDLFNQELRQAQQRLAVAWAEGQEYDYFDGDLVRRVLLERTRNHVYYIVLEDQKLVQIVAVHGAVCGAGPDFSA